MSNARKLADNLPTEGSLSGRNLLINGAMQIWQRGTSFSVNNAYNADRWLVDTNGGGGGQSTDAPDGFTYSLKIDPSSSNAALRQAIELPAAGEGGVFRSGQKFTLSFYVKSANAGEAINIFAASATSVGATTTAQVSAQTIGTTTTSWVRHIFTFTSNNVGGSDTCYNIVPFVVSPSGATYWTGFQLEVGPQSTPFEHEPFEATLRKCQRYYVKSKNQGYASFFGGVGWANQTTTWIGKGQIPVPMRTSPTLIYTGTARVQNGQAGYNISSLSMGLIEDNSTTLSMGAAASGLTLYRAHDLDAGASAATAQLDAEL
jgi:hypothetical protein